MLSFPSYSIYPDKQWRYGVVDCKPTFIPCENANEFDLRKCLPTIKVDAKLIKNWGFERKTKIHSCYSLYTMQYKIKKGDFVFTPRLLNKKSCEVDEDIETLELKPYGACKIRITVFTELE